MTKYIPSGSLNYAKLNKDGIYWYLNSRPVDLPKKVVDCFMDMLKQFSLQVKPILVINFKVEDDFYDVNLTPDKREISLANESQIVKELKIKINEFFESIQMSKLTQNLKKKDD